MKYLRILCILSSALLAACSDSNPASCSGKSTNDLIEQIINADAEQKIDTLVSGISEKANIKIGRSDIQDALKAIIFQLDDVRTMEKTDKSNLLQCAATLKLSIPEQIVDTALNAEAKSKNHNLSKLTEDLQVKNQLGAFKKYGGQYQMSVSYAIQPTDDGKKLFASLENTGFISKPLANILTAYLLNKPIGEKIKAAQDAEEKKQAELNDLNQQQLNDLLTEVKHNHANALKDINSLWDSLPKEAQAKYTASQTAWNKRHQSECAYQSKIGSDDPTEQAIEQFNCKTELIEARMVELNDIKENFTGELIKERTKQVNQAAKTLDILFERLPDDIQQNIGEEYQSWVEEFPNTCSEQAESIDDDSEKELADLTCRQREINKKIKEIKGYSI